MKKRKKSEKVEQIYKINCDQSLIKIRPSVDSGASGGLTMLLKNKSNDKFVNPDLGNNG